MAFTINEKIKDLANTDSILLKEFHTRRTGSLFYIYALPSNQLIFSSFTRKSANIQVKKLLRKHKKLKLTYDNSISIKSLDYNYSYSYGGYVFGSIMSLILLIITSIEIKSVYSVSFPLVFLVLFLWHLNNTFRSYFNQKEIEQKTKI